jgi:hypothetical protein
MKILKKNLRLQHNIARLARTIYFSFCCYYILTLCPCPLLRSIFLVITRDTLLISFLISRHIERIADHATNIAEEVIYMTEGEIVRHGKFEKMNVESRTSNIE